MNTTSTSTEANVATEKIGGWLYLPAISLVMGCIQHGILLLVSITMVTISFSGDSGGNEQLKAQGEILHRFALACSGVQIVLMALVVYAAVQFFSKRRKAPAAVITFLLAQIAGYGLLLAMTVQAGADRTIVNNPIEPGPNAIIAYFGIILAAVVWIPYFKISKRVKRTFVAG